MTAPVDNVNRAPKRRVFPDAERAVPQVLSQIREYGGVDRARLVLLLGLSIVWVLWQVWIAVTVVPSPVQARSIHLAFGLTAAFLFASGLTSPRNKALGLAVDLVIAATGAVALAHLYVNFDSPDFRRLVNPEQIDIVLGTALMSILLVGLWRVTGLPLALTVVVAIAYAFYGQYIPGPAGHGGFPPSRILSILYLQLDGILGSTTGASATTIFPVLLFGAMLLVLGGGQFFTQFAVATLGRTRGAGGKIATVASALFATVTGTGGSGVAVTGSLTIPLMKRTGYSPTRAAGIESSASIGGQVLPPVMGASAFAMAEFLSISYAKIVVYALIPGILYFATMFVIVHLEARRSGAVPLPESEIPRVGDVLRSGGHFILPLAGFLGLITVVQVSVARSAILATATLFVLEFGRRLLTRSALGLTDLLDGCVQTVRTAVIVAVAVGGIQVLVAVVGLTGLGVKLSSLLIDLSGGNLVVLLVLTMFASILLGTGLPTLPTYLVLAVMVAPALTEFGVHPVAAHMFILYFGVFGDLTPPTALGPTIAAGIAQAPLLRSMLSAVKYGALGFALPYMFVASPGLLLLEGPQQAVIDVSIVLVAVLLAGAAMAGFGLAITSPSERVLAAAASVALVIPLVSTRLIGFVLTAIFLAVQLARRRRDAPAAQVSNLTNTKKA